VELGTVIGVGGGVLLLTAGVSVHLPPPSM
jgi:hypothetical protein